jgi:hypothetical protein
MEIKSDELRAAWSGGIGTAQPANDEPETDASFAGLILCIAGFDVLMLGGLWAYMYAPTIGIWWADMLQKLGVA